ncbi:cellobiohydrolase I-I [Crucibulum laeve]|uniref:Glucanase n=1 Tax=Crucibulum laeve TaxID=68775 RepID=A0A5C3LLZ2_9AGAR|nr:cellobiohydrolase I-I [Crucibulum laeve]
MFNKVALISFTFFAVAFGQQVGTSTAEVHPALPWKRCTASGCTTVSAGAVSLDANWRWLHTTSGYTNCYTGNKWDTTLCPDGKTCAQNCAIEGANYASTYGITTSADALTLKFVTQSAGKNIGSRVYLMASDTQYELFKLLNKEFTFDVDVSKLPCGLNGALYFSEMDADGGLSKYATNKAGAKYGTGYCDSQCPRDVKFIKGEANVVGWNPSDNDANAGFGNWGACCNEMDIWEANAISTAYTPHPCTAPGLTRSEGALGRYETVCDPDGCDFNSFRMGDKGFYGKGLTLDTSKKMTIVTQFLTHDNTTTGNLKEIRRIYLQDGKVIQNSKVNVPGMAAYDSITTEYCDAQKTAFGDYDSFKAKGGMQKMSDGLKNGMVLVLSVWDDHAANMLWLDSNYPTDADASKPGVARGTCATTSGKPADVEVSATDASVTFSNIKVGDIGTTFTGSSSGGGGSSSAPTSSSTVSSAAPAATQTKYGQCGGQGWTGPTVCASGSTCTFSNTWYSQCL